MKLIKSIPLCSQCLKQEITSWLNEKPGTLDELTIKNIYLELRDIKIEQGQCIVCKHDKISADCSVNIFKLLEKHKVKEEIRKEFLKMFAFLEV